MNAEDKNLKLFTELFSSNASKIIKFYSSVSRVFNYSIGREYQYGKDRIIRKYSTLNWKNPFTPKFSKESYDALKEEANKELFNKYQQQVLSGDIVEQQKNEFAQTENDYINNDGSISATHLRFVHNLEASWLFHRAFHKLFSDYHTKTKVFLDLDAYTITPSHQFFLREFLNYLEGNYVVSVRGTGRVYIPHLQAERDSVDLPYTSAHGMGGVQVIADYFEKSLINSSDELLKDFDDMISFEADIIGGRGKIFLQCSQYIDQDVYQKMFREWLQNIAKEIGVGNFHNRKLVMRKVGNLIENKTLKIPPGLFKERVPDLGKFEDTFEDDKTIFLKNESSAVRRLLRALFISLMEFSINRYRMESKGGPHSERERTEYESVFRSYRDMTELEQLLNVLLVEDGEISFVLMLSRYIQHIDTKNVVDCNQLVRWGLIEKQEQSGRYKFSPRARRMAKWVARVAAVNLSPNKTVPIGLRKTFAIVARLPGLRLFLKDLSLNYTDNEAIKGHYFPFTKEDNSLFAWLSKLAKNNSEFCHRLSEIALSQESFVVAEVVRPFRHICELCFDGSIESDIVKQCVTERSRFNQDLNEFLRANETISRAVVAIPISTIPTNLVGLRDKIYGFSIFISTFKFDEGLDDPPRFAHEIRKIARTLKYAKIYFTLIGVPASQVLHQFVVEEVAGMRVTEAMGKFAHALKNEGEFFRTQLEALKPTSDELMQRENIKTKFDNIERAFTTLSGAMKLLNLAANPIRKKYLGKPYCIVDVILRAYCNAFDHFYLAGSEREKMRLSESELFATPILHVTVKNIGEPGSFELRKKLDYYPNLTGITFGHNHTNKLDADDLLEPEQLFKDLLPEQEIMETACSEMFNNALQYSCKDEKKIPIDVLIMRNSNEIKVDVINYTSKDHKNRIEQLNSRAIAEQSIGRGAGVDTNALLFRKLGGNFSVNVDSDYKVIASSRINLNYLRKINEEQD